jgi:hypothetical protein
MLSRFAALLELNIGMSGVTTVALVRILNTKYCHSYMLKSYLLE